MSQYFRRYIKKQHYPIHSSQIKFKTNFQNCILQTMLDRQHRQTEQDDWDIFWCEKQFVIQSLDKIRLNPEKRINHFRNWFEICRKDLLWKNIKKYKKTLQKQGKQQQSSTYNFLPLTYNLPSEYPIFAQEYKRNKDNKTLWIMKPIGKSQGKGIFIFKNITDICQWTEISNQPEPYIVQKYIHNPLLIGHKKFDLRLYVLVISHNPLVIYLYRSGFARFTHYRYSANDFSSYESHLTNVAIQKITDNYDEQRGGKYRLDRLRLYMISKYGSQSVNVCFTNIKDLIIKTFVATSKIIVNDKRCFELYGVDVMIDDSLKPWLIEINGSPSMTANTIYDRQLKNGLLDDTLSAVNIQKLLFDDQQQIGGYDLIYKNKKIKNNLNNLCLLGCNNNRDQQMRKLAKCIALKLAQKRKLQFKQKQVGRNNRGTNAVYSNPNQRKNYSGTNKQTNNSNSQYNEEQSKNYLVKKLPMKINDSLKLPRMSNNSNNMSNKVIPDLKIKKNEDSTFSTGSKNSKRQ